MSSGAQIESSLSWSKGTDGVPLARDAALVEAGLDLQITAQANVGVFYVGHLANRAQDNAVHLEVLADLLSSTYPRSPRQPAGRARKPPGVNPRRINLIHEAIMRHSSIAS